MGQAVSTIIEDDECFALTSRIQDADAVVDFSSPQGALDALQACVADNVPLVTGTTALGSDWRAARDAAARSVAILEAPNMSLGVNLGHLAFNRSIFARGALRAAEWIRTVSPGTYSMRDVLGG